MREHLLSEKAKEHLCEVLSSEIKDLERRFDRGEKCARNTVAGFYPDVLRIIEKHNFVSNQGRVILARLDDLKSMRKGMTT